MRRGKQICLRATSEVGASLVAQMVNKPSAMQETWIQHLDWEDHLEKGNSYSLQFLPGDFHGQRSLMGYSPWVHRERLILF